MKDEHKAKELLVNELVVLRKRIAELEESEAEWKQAEKASRSEAFIAALNRIAIRIETTLDPDQVMKKLGDELGKLGMTCVVGMLGPDGGELVIRYTSIESAVLASAEKLVGFGFRDYRIPREVWPSETAFEDGRSLFEPNPIAMTAALMPGIPKAIVERIVRLVGVTPNTAVVYLPLTVEKRAIGVVAIWGADVLQDDVPALAVFASQVAIAIENARLHAETKRELAERVRAEKKIQQARAELETMVRERTSELETANEHLEEEVKERIRVEEILRSSEERLKILFEYAPDAYYLNDLRGAFVDGNKAAEETTGYRKEELIGKNFLRLRLLPIGEIPKAARLLRHSARGQPTGPDELLLKRKDGSQVSLEVRTYPVKIQGQALVLGIARDITERKRVEEELRQHRDNLEELVKERAAELVRTNEQLLQETIERKRVVEKLRNREQQYRNLFDGVPVGLYRTSSEGQILDANLALVEMLGYPDREALLAEKATDIYADPGDRQREQVFLERDGIVRGFRVRLFRRDGMAIWTEDNARAVLETDGRVLYYEGSIRDITERVRAEQALQESASFYRTTIDSMGDPMHVVDRDLRFSLCNEALTQWCKELDIALGGEVIGHTIFDVFPFLPDQVREEYREVFDTGAILVTESAITIKDREVITDTRKVPVYEGGIVAQVITVIRDITERKKMEGELLKTQKLESLGVLAGGIAHDFNNILAAILGNISLARMSGSPGDEILEALTEAEKASMQAKRLTEQLLTFSQGGAPVKETASIGEVTQDSVGFALRGSNTRCVFSIPDDLWTVEVDEGQINQVVNNLAINAVQSMPRGGTIRVGIENVMVDVEDSVPLPGGKYVKIAVADDGIGIPEKDLSRVFDPFFTTKGGSGLGLATSFSIVKRHEGHISVESELGAGATFHIWLPASQKEVAAREKEVEAETTSGGGKILVVDDEETVRNVAGKMLNHLGYEVEFAEDGAEAIELYRRAKEAGCGFDAVIMDLTIPGGMGGKEAVGELIAVDSEARVIASSGYSNDPIMADFVERGFSGVIPKPYTMNELDAQIRKVITKQALS